MNLKDLGNYLYEKMIKEKLVSPIRRDFNFLGDNTITLNDKVRKTAETSRNYADYLSSFKGRMETKLYIEGFIQAKGMVKREHFEEVSDKIRAITKQEIEDAITDFFSKNVTQANALKSAEGIKEFVNNFPEDAMISIIGAVDDTLSPKVKTLLYEMWGYDETQSAEDRVKEWRKDILATSDADLAQKLQDGANDLHVDVITDAVYEMAQSCTADKLEKFFTEFSANIDRKRCKELVSKGIQLSKVFSEAVLDEKYDALAKSSAGKEFAEVANKTCRELEDAFIASGLTPDKNPLDVYRQAQKEREEQKKKGPGGDSPKP